MTDAVSRSTGGGCGGAAWDITELPLCRRIEERDRRADLCRRGLEVLELEADRRTAGLTEGALMAAMADDALAKYCLSMQSIRSKYDLASFSI